MTLEATVMAMSALAAIASVSTVLFDLRKPRRAGPERTITITIEDPVAGLIRTVTRSTRRADQIRRDVERALRDGC